MKRLLLLTLGLTMIGAAKAQEEKLEIKPSGRILLDGGLFKANEQDSTNSFSSTSTGIAL